MHNGNNCREWHSVDRGARTRRERFSKNVHVRCGDKSQRGFLRKDVHVTICQGEFLQERSKKLLVTFVTKAQGNFSNDLHVRCIRTSVIKAQGGHTSPERSKNVHSRKFQEHSGTYLGDEALPFLAEHLPVWNEPSEPHRLTDFR